MPSPECTETKLQDYPCRDKRVRNYFDNWRSHQRLSDQKHVKSPSFFSRNKTKSLSSQEKCCKVFLEKTIRQHLRIHDMNRKDFLGNQISCFSLEYHSKIMRRIATFYLMSSCSSCQCSSIYTGLVQICDVMMSHTCFWVRVQAAIAAIRAGFF